jgi:hypothetical protein
LGLAAAAVVVAAVVVAAVVEADANMGQYCD